MKNPPPVEYLQHLFREGEFESAVSASDSLLHKEPRNVRALYWKASSLLRMERHQEALEVLDLAIDIYDEYADAISQRGVVFFHIGELAMALSDMDRAVELEPLNPYR